MTIRSTKTTRKREGKTIINTDKGEAVALWIGKVYSLSCQLSHITNYKKLKNDPSLQHHKLGNDTTNRFKKEKLLPKNIADGLTTANLRAPMFCMSLKIQKAQ